MWIWKTSAKIFQLFALAAIRNARKLQLERKITTKYASLLFAQTLVTLACESVLRAEVYITLSMEWTTAYQNCAIDRQPDLINYANSTGFTRDDAYFMHRTYYFIDKLCWRQFRAFLSHSET